ncbi:DUF6257 family protein [Streptomyces sp. NPDC042207]|uniref:DUF6257 family protein n=1 Tax=Streptomyces sp. NPDC042207 TaxID=3154331 RepID=UPI00340FEE3C
MAADDLQASDFTFGEKARLAGLVARMAKRGIADDGSGRLLRDLQRRVERIEDQARRRKHGK